ncbi:MAG: hypothetical protein RR505_06720 [Raoultibacter sp.]
MAVIHLNIQQEMELIRLIEFERAKSVSMGSEGRKCAFPYRPDNTLQAELISLGALAVMPQQTADGATQPIVTITNEGYTFFTEKARREREDRKQQRRDYILVLISGAFAMLCTVIGFLIGKIV